MISYKTWVSREQRIVSNKGFQGYMAWTILVSMASVLVERFRQEWNTSPSLTDYEWPGLEPLAQTVEHR